MRAEISLLIAALCFGAGSFCIPLPLEEVVGEFSRLFSLDLESLKTGNTSDLVRILHPDEFSTDDSCYIISLREETPPSMIELLSSFLKERGEAETLFRYSSLLKGLAVCFPAQVPLDLVKRIPWINMVEHDSVVQSTAELHAQKNAPWGLAKISQPKHPDNASLYEYEWTGKNVNVYIVDSNIFGQHPGICHTIPSMTVLRSSPANHADIYRILIITYRGAPSGLMLMH